MPKKRFSAEQIVVVLRQIEVFMSQGKTPAVACREAGIRSRAIIAGERNTAGSSLIRRSG